MRILITGISGFIGGHLVERLLAEGGHAVAGFSREVAWPTELAHLASKITYHTANLLETSAIEQIIRDFKPDWLFHLAGYASAGKSFREPETCWTANLAGTQSLFPAVERSGVRPRILFASTGLVYGDPEPGHEAFDESATLKPASPYATSKAAADLLAYQVTRHPGLDVVRVRMFNQIGPRQTADYAVANFARQIAEAERGLRTPVIETGDLSGMRDLTDVRDMTAAYCLLQAKARTGDVYNVGSGRVWRMSDILDQLRSLSSVPVEVRQTVDVRRGADTAVSRADPRKIVADVGWKPQYELADSLRDILDYWRNRT